MQDTHTIEMQIPLIAGEEYFADGAMAFSLCDASSPFFTIVHAEGDLKLTLSVETKAIREAVFHSDTPVERYSVSHVMRMKAVVKVSGIGEKLLAHIARHFPHSAPRRDEVGIHSEYVALASRIESMVIGRVARLVEWAKAHRGQLWLREFAPSVAGYPVLLKALNASIAIGEKQVSFTPYCSRPRTIRSSGPGRAVNQADWEALKAYVCGTNRLPFVSSALVAAEGLLESGHLRSALVEGVAGLESALQRYAASPPMLRFYQDSPAASRIPGTTLRGVVERLGLTASVTYLLPLLLDGQVAPIDLANCSSAILERNEVVHSGRRKLSAERIHEQLNSIRAVVMVLWKNATGEVPFAPNLNEGAFIVEISAQSVRPEEDLEIPAPPSAQASAPLSNPALDTNSELGEP